MSYLSGAGDLRRGSVRCNGYLRARRYCGIDHGTSANLAFADWRLRSSIFA
jgi:prepilin-type processing-associated H-X9-DG protein